ncbi:hypothetical protein VNI00_019216 [Paramarasmius palmivorus]|uniref:Uncharacterized protein n=1 Tax=Paramarasmius palmivorus TaxID=297713 RepID=A0AAW0ASS2_9AGAR
MGGFAVYDDKKFYGYIWNDGEVGTETDHGGVDYTVRDKIQEHHRIIQMATAELDKRPEEKDEECFLAPQTEETRFISTGNVTESQDQMAPKSLNDNAHLLEFLIQHGYITITEDEIMDNLSHSDSITKIIAVIQTTWFLLQIAGRAVEGLAITELEIITVGFAVLNFGTYFLWWNKPLRVRHPVRVYWRHQKVAERKDEDEENQGEKIREFIVGAWDSIRDASVKFGMSMIVLFNFLRDPTERDPELNDDSLPNMKWVTLLRLVGLPFLVVFRLIWASMFLIADGHVDLMAFVVHASRLKEESITLYILVYGLTTLFGVIHCIPWNFQFQTHTEQLLWRISASGLVALPLTLIVVLLILQFSPDNIDHPSPSLATKIIQTTRNVLVTIILITTVIITSVLPFAYIIARVILMVLALMELRNLPLSAYQTVQWTTFIPHIG